MDVFPTGDGEIQKAKIELDMAHIGQPGYIGSTATGFRRTEELMSRKYLVQRRLCCGLLQWRYLQTEEVVIQKFGKQMTTDGVKLCSIKILIQLCGRTSNHGSSSANKICFAYLQYNHLSRRLVIIIGQTESCVLLLRIIYCVGHGSQVGFAKFSDNMEHLNNSLTPDL